jgi:hypothetical protein
MKTNMSNIDRAIRVVVALVIATLYFNGTLTGGLGLVLILASAVFVLTSLIGFCPLYALIGFSTCKTKN